MKTKLESLAKHGRCPGVPEKNITCGKKFGSLKDVAFDHIARDEQTHDNSVENCRPLCHECHSIKTFGTGATSAGSDIHMAAKTKRIAKKQAAHRRALDIKDGNDVECECVKKRPRAKAKIANRPWAKKQVKRESE
jgi:hypothetical protein